MRFIWISSSALVFIAVYMLTQAPVELGVLDKQNAFGGSALTTSSQFHVGGHSEFVTVEQPQGSAAVEGDFTQGVDRSLIEAQDPDDPYTWKRYGDLAFTENVGEPADPDDPSTWPQPESTEVINIGEPMDPDDPSTWPQSESTEVINIGEPMDPDDPSTWPQSESTEVINIGEPMDPDDPSTWPQ